MLPVSRNRSRTPDGPRLWVNAAPQMKPIGFNVVPMQLGTTRQQSCPPRQIPIPGGISQPLPSPNRSPRVEILHRAIPSSLKDSRSTPQLIRPPLSFVRVPNSQDPPIVAHSAPSRTSLPSPGSRVGFSPSLLYSTRSTASTVQPPAASVPAPVQNFLNVPRQDDLTGDVKVTIRSPVATSKERGLEHAEKLRGTLATFQKEVEKASQIAEKGHDKSRQTLKRRDSVPERRCDGVKTSDDVNSSAARGKRGTSTSARRKTSPSYVPQTPTSHREDALERKRRELRAQAESLKAQFEANQKSLALEKEKFTKQKDMWAKEKAQLVRDIGTLKRENYAARQEAHESKASVILKNRELLDCQATLTQAKQKIKELEQVSLLMEQSNQALIAENTVLHGDRNVALYGDRNGQDRRQSNNHCERASERAVKVLPPVDSDWELRNTLHHFGGERSASLHIERPDNGNPARSEVDGYSRLEVDGYSRHEVDGYSRNEVNSHARSEVNGHADGLARREVNGHARHEVDGHARHEVDSLVRHEVNGHARHEVDSLARHEVDGYTRHEVNGHARHEVDGLVRHEVDGYTRHEVDGHARHEVDSLARHEVDSLARHEVDSHARYEVDSHARPEVDIHARHKVDSHARHEVDSHARHEVNGHARHEVDGLARHEVNGYAQSGEQNVVGMAVCEVETETDTPNGVGTNHVLERRVEESSNTDRMELANEATAQRNTDKPTYAAEGKGSGRQFVSVQVEDVTPMMLDSVAEEPEKEEEAEAEERVESDEARDSDVDEVNLDSQWIFVIQGQNESGPQEDFDRKKHSYCPEDALEKVKERGIVWVCERGRRHDQTVPNQDDFLLALQLIPNGQHPRSAEMVTQVALYGVFDGHGPLGHKCSDFARTYLPESVFGHKLLFNQPEIALKEAFLNVHTSMLEQQFDCSVSGTTAALAMVMQVPSFNGETQSWLICAHVGDSRLLLAAVDDETGSPRATITQISADHRPENEREEARINESEHGEVRIINATAKKRVFARGKVSPALALTRCLGNASAAELGVSWEPEVMAYRLRACDKALILGTDGLFEFCSNEEVASVLMSDGLESLPAICQEARRRWKEHSSNQTVDDITAIVVPLDIAHR